MTLTSMRNASNETKQTKCFLESKKLFSSLGYLFERTFKNNSSRRTQILGEKSLVLNANEFETNFV